MQTLKYNLDLKRNSQWEFVTCNEFARQNFLYIQEAGNFYAGADYFTQREGLDSFLIKLTLNGSGILEYCSKEYSLKPGSLFFIDCNTPQYYRTDKKSREWNVLWLHLNGKSARAYYEMFLLYNNNSPVAELKNPAAIEEKLNEILALSKNYISFNAPDIRASALLSELLSLIITDSFKTGDLIYAPEFVKNAAGYISKNYAEDINLDLLSQKANVSKYHLQRTFKQYFGITPAEYLTGIRIDKAKKLLRSSNIPVGEVAMNVGMDTNYFIQVFKRYEKTTPLKYRNNWQVI